MRKKAILIDMDSLSDILKQSRPQEPPQIQALKQYVFDKHGITITASATQRGYIISVPSAPLATILRMELPQIEAKCNLDKKLFIRISS